MQHKSYKFFLPWRNSPRGPRLPHRGFTITLRHSTLGRTLWTSDHPTHRPLPNKTHHSQETDIHASGGIRTHYPSKRVAADPRLRPRGHWDRLRRISLSINVLQQQGQKGFTKTFWKWPVRRKHGKPNLVMFGIPKDYTLHTVFLSFMMPCGLVGGFKHLGGKCRPTLQVRRWR
jgi:hypothetical protein